MAQQQSVTLDDLLPAEAQGSVSLDDLLPEAGVVEHAKAFGLGVPRGALHGTGLLMRSPEMALGSVGNVLRSMGMEEQTVEGLLTFARRQMSLQQMVVPALGRMLGEAAQAIPRVPGTEGAWSETVGEGIGYLAPIAVAGAATAGAGIPPMVSASLLGATASGTSLYERARESGASPERQLLATSAGAAFGSLEGLGAGPAAIRLGRVLAGASPGFRRVMAGLFVESVRGGFEEGVQETVQSTGEKLIAQYILEDQHFADSLQGWLEEFGESAVNEGIPASIVGMLAAGGAHIAETAVSPVKAPAQTAQEAPGSTLLPVEPQAVPEPGTQSGALEEAGNAALAQAIQTSQEPAESTLAEEAPEAQPPIEAQPEAAGEADVTPEAAVAPPVEPGAAAAPLGGEQAVTPEQPEAAAPPDVPSVETEPAVEAVPPATEPPAQPPTPPAVEQTPPVTPQPAPGQPITPETRAEREIRRWIDVVGTWKRVVDEDVAQRQSETPQQRDKRDVVLAERLRKNLESERHRNRSDEFYEQIPKALREAGVSREAINEVLIARRIPEYRKVVAARNPKWTPEQVAQAGGMTDQQAAEILAKWKADPRWPKIQKVLALHDRMQRSRLKDLEGAGLLAPGEAEALGERGPSYTSFRQHLEDEVQRSGRGIALRGREYRAILGSFKQAEDPLTASVMQDMVSSARIEKARVERALYEFVKQRNDPSFASIVPKDQWLMRRLVERGGKKVVEWGYDPTYAEQPHVVPIKINGEEMAIEFKPEHEPLARALKRLDVQHGYAWVQRWGDLTRWFKRVVTQHNPFWMPINFVKDTPFTYLKQWSIRGPAFANAMLTRLPRMWRSWAMQDELYQRYVKAGGRMPTMGVEGYRVTQKKIQRLIDSGEMRQGLREILAFVDTANDAVENGLRMAVFDVVTQQGATDAQGVLAAQEANVNFGARGELTPVFDALYAFYGAGMAGNRALVHMLKGKRAGRVLGSVIAGTAVLTQWNRMVAGDDDNGENRYDKKPESEKAANLIVMLPNGGADVPGLGDVDSIKIPLSPGLAFFFNLGRYIGDAFYGPESPSSAATKTVANFIDNINPLGTAFFEEGSLTPSAESIAQTVSPTLTDPLVQVGMNVRWTGQPLAPENLPFGPQKPDSELYFKGVSPTAKQFTDFLNHIADFDDSGKADIEAFDISPATVEHLVRSYLPGVFQVVPRAARGVEKLARGEEIEARDIPVVYRFFGTENPYYTVRKFRDNMREIEAATARYKDLLSSGERERAKAWHAANAHLIKAGPRLKVFEKTLAKIPDSPATEERRMELMARFNKSLRGKE